MLPKAPTSEAQVCSDQREYGGMLNTPYYLKKILKQV